MKRVHWVGIYLGLTFAEPALAAWHVEVTSPHPGPSSICTFWGDEMQVSVYDGRRQLAVHRYCSAYGRGSATIVADARGQGYLLLRHSVGHGTHATRDLLTIYRIDNGLVERGSLIAREPIGSRADANYDYTIRTPRSGGLELVGSVKVTGGRSELDVPPEPPPRLKIDLP